LKRSRLPRWHREVCPIARLVESFTSHTGLWVRICTGPFRSSALHLVYNLHPLSREAESREAAPVFKACWRATRGDCRPWLKKSTARSLFAALFPGLTALVLLYMTGSVGAV